MFEPNGAVFQWMWTDPQVGNCWCILAGGVCMYSFPIWLYCDDVSKNQSKRWNKHYSFLFLAAGLPCALFQHECHVQQMRSLQMRDNTIQELHNIIADARSLGNVSKIQAHKTSTGFKDTFLETFLEWMHLLYRSESSRHEKQAALDNFMSMLPANIKMLRPVWQIQGMFILSMLCMSSIQKH